MKTQKKHIWLTLLSLMIFGLIVYALLPKPVTVDLAYVERGRLTVTVDEDGKTRIKERYMVSAPLGGRLRRIEWKAGDTVRAGQTILAVIEPNDPSLLDARAIAQAEAQVKAAEATNKQALPNLERARSNYEFATTDLKRAQELSAMGGVSHQELDNAEHRERTAAEDLKAAEYAVQIAEFELEQAKAALLRTRPSPNGEIDMISFEIRSPINGRVLRVFQESATVVMAGSQLLELGDPTDLEVEVDVLSTDAVKSKPGAKVFLEHWGGVTPLIGRVRLVEPAAFTKISALGVEEQRVNVIIDFDDPPEKRQTLGDAYRVEARIIIWEGDDVLKIPTAALFRSSDDWAVYDVTNGRATLRRVTIGQTNGLEAEVLEGLNENDSVIIHPSDKISDGVAIVPR